MMRLQTEQLFPKHLMALADHESQAEKQRVQLNEIYNFHPKSAFQRLDRYKNGKLNAFDIATFLRDNGYNFFSHDCKELVLAFDVDQDGNLDYSEFERLVLTSKDPILRTRAISRYESYIGMKDILSFEQEHNLSKLILFEMKGLAILGLDRESIRSRFDFSRYDAFKAIDFFNLGTLMREDLRKFLNRNQQYATVLDADHLMTRIDLDQDGIISYQEFCRYIDLPKGEDDLKSKNSMSQSQSMANLNSGNRKFKTPATKREDSASPERAGKLSNTEAPRAYQSPEPTLTNESIYVRSQYTTPLKKKSNRGAASKKSTQQKSIASLETTPSPTKQETSPSQQLKPKKLNLEEALKQDSGSKDNKNLNRISEVNQSDEEEKQGPQGSMLANEGSVNGEKPVQLTPLNIEDEAELAEAMKAFISFEMDNEKAKQQLSLKADFNLLDAFRLFDKFNLGHIYKLDFEEGLKRLGVFAPFSEIDLLFKRYDLDFDNKLRYIEFVTLLCPKDKIYADHLNNKRPNYTAKSEDEAISVRTKLELGETLRVLLRNEGFAEEVRKTLNQKNQFSITGAFQTLDANENGSLNKVELKAYLDHFEFFATQKEIDLLHEKFDKDRDGKISYSEFFSELAPKLLYF